MTTEAAPNAPIPPAGRGGALSGSAALTLHRIVMQATGLALMLVAARFLSPAEFGLLGLVVVTAQIQQQIAETGWFEYVTNWPAGKPLPPEAFWCAMGYGVAASGLGVVSAAVIWLVIGSPSYALAMLILSVASFTSPVAMVQIGVLTREARLGVLGVWMCFSELIGLGVGLYGLFQGWGIYALAAHKVSCYACITLGALALGGWRPPFAAQAGAVRDAVGFAWHILLSRLSVFANNLGSDYMVGVFLLGHEAGLFRAANRLAGAVAEMISEPARMVSWSIMSRAAMPAEGERRAPQELKLIHATVFMVALPAFAGMALVAEPLIVMMLGEAWRGAALALSLLCAGRAFMAAVPLVQPAMSLAGQAKALPRVMAVLTVINLSLVAGLAWIGLAYAAAAQVLAGLVTLPVFLRLLVRHGGLEWRGALADLARTSICVAVMGAAAITAGAFVPLETETAWRTVAAMIGAGVLAYALALLVVRPLPVRMALARLRGQA
jgi:O-antigen/teichoic acid export membrane protein